MDITQALAPNSDQLDAIELVEPRTFTIAPGSRLGKRDNRVVAEIALVELDRVWRPSKGMLDVLADCWGPDGKQWVGRRVTLYNDRNVKFGPNRVGGTRISHLSDITKARDVQIRGAGTSGSKQTWHVEPLADLPPERPWLQELEQAGGDLDAIAALGKAARAGNAPPQVIDTILAAWNQANRATQEADEPKEQNA